MIPIDYLAILIAAVASMVLGGLWYGPVFGKPWMRMMGFTKESMKEMKMKGTTAMAIMFLACLVMAFVLAHGLLFAQTYLVDFTLAGALMGGFFFWLGFIVPVTLGVVLWEGKSWKLFALNAGYYLVSVLLMSTILTSSLGA